MSKGSITWENAVEIRRELIGDGWLSPDTYCRSFAPVIPCPGVYLFLLMDQESYERAIIAYVGMSAKLSKRLEQHSVMRELETTGFWPQRWFKPAEKSKVRELEREYIAKFDPPWNIQGRSRGVAF